MELLNKFKFKTIKMEFKILSKIEANENNFDFILDSIQSSLANCESNKCLTESDDQITTISYSQCWCRILNELIHSNPNKIDSFIAFFQSSINSFHTKNICSCKTLISFSLLLWRHLKLNIITNNLSPKKLSSHLITILNKIIDLVQANKLIYLEQDLSNKLNVNLKLSRHYETKIIDYNNLKPILNGICRNQSIISDLIWKLLELHMKNNTEFNYDNIVILSMSKASQINKSSNNVINSFDCQITNGVVLKLDNNNYEILKSIDQNVLNSLAIDGSLVFNYSFLGFNKNLESIQYHGQSSSHLTVQELWQNQIRNVLIQNNLKILFIRGKIDNDLQNFCLFNSILVFKNLSSDIFKHLIIDDCVPVVYIEHMEPHNIFKSEYKLLESLNSYYINFNAFNTNMFTILIETRLQSTSDLYKEYLNHCLKRVHNILTSSQYILGNGNVEKYLFEEITNKIACGPNDTSHDGVYFDIVKDVFTNTFRDFSLIVSNNSSSLAQTYDDLESKLEAWRTACLINRFFLNTDLAIKI